MPTETQPSSTSWFTRICLIVLVLGLGMLFLWPDRPATPSPTEPDRAQAKQASPADARSKSKTIELQPRTPDPRPVEPTVDDVRAAREQLRASILAQQAQAAAAGSKRVKATMDEDEAAAVGGLQNKIGGHAPLLTRLNEDFMPLANECIASAHERDPSTAGMLAVNFEIISDEALGSIVETVDFPEQSTIVDEELRTCIRETTLSMILPEAPSGREQFMLTLSIDKLDKLEEE